MIATSSGGMKTGTGRFVLMEACMGTALSQLISDDLRALTGVPGRKVNDLERGEQ
jgi:hypothetical protein